MVENQGNPGDLSDRIRQVIAADSNEVVAERLGAWGYPTSRDTVRRYRQAQAERIDASFCAALCSVYGVSPAWLLLGEGEAIGGRDVEGAIRSFWRHFPVELGRLLIYAGARSSVDGVKEVGWGHKTPAAEEIEGASKVLYGLTDASELSSNPKLREYYQEVLHELGRYIGGSDPPEFNPGEE